MFRVKQAANTLKINHNCALLKRFVICVAVDAFSFLFAHPSLAPNTWSVPGEVSIRPDVYLSRLLPLHCTRHPSLGVYPDSSPVMPVASHGTRVRVQTHGVLLLATVFGAKEKEKSSLRDRRNGACACVCVSGRVRETEGKLGRGG